MTRFLKPILTSEPSLEPTEPIDYKALSSRRYSMQRHTWETARWNHSYKESEAEYHHRVEEQLQEEINNWRMQDDADLEDSLLEMEGR